MKSNELGARLTNNKNVIKFLTPLGLGIMSSRIKMAIILPTGQWYAPSAVINDAGYCMALHGIA